MEANRYTIYQPNNQPLAIVQILHGMQEYKERYNYFIEQLLANNIVCVVHDHLGHGLNCPKEDLGFFKENNGFKQLVYDTCEIQTMMQKQFPKLPYILFGHSMGSIVARNYLKQYDSHLSALILSGAPNYTPAVKLGQKLAKLVVKTKGPKVYSPFLTKLFMGNFNKGYAEPNMWLSKNPLNVSNYNKDPNCGFPFTAKGFEDIALGLIEMHKISDWKLTNQKLPILFIAGENDPCIGDVKGFNDSINTLKKVGYQAVEAKKFPSLRHEILNEEEKDEVIAYILTWLQNQQIL